MKTKVIIIICFFSIIVHAQVEPSVTYDNSTGNYIVTYLGYLDYNSDEQSLIKLIFEPSTKIIPTIHTSVYDEESTFHYNYIVANNANSQQRLRYFDLEIYSSLDNVSSPNENWRFSSYSFVPVSGWYNSKDPSGLNHPLNGIAPDSSASGFSFTTSGLPSIVKSYSKGKPTTILSFPDEPPGEISNLLRPLRKFPNNTIIKLTVGPKDPPNPFIHSDFLDTLANYTTQSFNLGWITDEQTKTKYENYFFYAKDALVNLDTSSARSFLENVLTDVDTDSSSTLTSEAYALLRYNTEHLIKELGR